MINADKKAKKTYILYSVAILFFLLYTVWELSKQDQAGALISGVAAICCVGALIMKRRENKALAIQREKMQNAAPVVSASLEQQLRDMMAQEKKIQAIKLLREETEMSLYDATNYVEALVAKD